MLMLRARSTISFAPEWQPLTAMATFIPLPGRKRWSSQRWAFTRALASPSSGPWPTLSRIHIVRLASVSNSVLPMRDLWVADVLPERKS